MKKYLFHSSLHDNQEVVVYLPNSIDNVKSEHKTMYTTPTVYKYPYEGSNAESLFLLSELYSAKEIIFSRKEVLERYEVDQQMYNLSVIGIKEWDKRQDYWIKYLKNL